MPQVDIATIRFISGIQFLLLPSFLLLLLWSQRTRAVILWTIGGWLFGIGSLLLLFVLSDPFVGGDVLVRTIFFSALVFRISALKDELDVNVRKFYIFLALAAYVASHEAVRTIFGTELSRQIFTSTITSVTSFYAGCKAYVGSTIQHITSQSSFCIKKLIKSLVKRNEVATANHGVVNVNILSLTNSI